MVCILRPPPVCDATVGADEVERRAPYGSPKSALEEVREVEGRYLEAFGRVLPHLPAGELWWRFKAMIGALVFRQTAAYAAAPEPLGTSPEGEGTDRARTITFLSAALRTPAAVPLDAARGEEEG